MPCTFYNLCLYNLAALQPKILELTLFYLLYMLGMGGSGNLVNPKTCTVPFCYVIPFLSSHPKMQ